MKKIIFQLAPGAGLSRNFSILLGMHIPLNFCGLLNNQRCLFGSVETFFFSQFTLKFSFGDTGTFLFLKKKRVCFEPAHVRDVAGLEPTGLDHSPTPASK